ncbi:serine/threonine-protein kinase [Streptomyces sp. ITFR-16]|uniref:serine/threonine-protein kinase n=1 Tax=Streptomyces sp. ITFR-16 TaxID=3075198 RepID=UPI00288A0835|nr:serine/threonine-protein kinase [Streptomyces sp. ITFR-16]WNI24570.1 serine/threonine-protein kinase [Streptomyces sp. ITFR-16]
MSGQQPKRGSASQVFQPLAGDDPSTIAGYRLAAKLGAGGMGKVYLSYTPGGRPVAIKVIRPEFGEDAEFRRRFAQEVQSAQRVQGLFTAPVIDADTDGAQPWLATAYVPGPSLADAVVAHGALPVDAVLLLIAGMAEALHVIHGAGIVHRDLKPSNVLLAADGPRVIDFGIAYAADATSLTGSGVTIGTPSFMAPEQAAGRRVTPATDIFALGQVAAFASTGAPAFGEGTSHGVLYRIVHEDPDLSGVPERLMELVSRCLAKDPADRPSVAEVITLCQTANAETVLRRPEDWLPTPVAADITVRAAAPAPVQTPPPPSSAPTAGPSAAYSPTAPAAPSTPPPGYGPPVAPPPGQAPQTPPPTPYPAQAHAQAAYPTQPAQTSQSAPQYPTGPQAQAQAPTQFPGGYGYPAQAQTYTGQSGPQTVVPSPPAPEPPKRRGGKVAAIAVAAALIFGVAGVGTAYFLLKDDGKKTQSNESAKEKSNTPAGKASPSPGADDEGGTGTDPKPPVDADPEPADYTGINLTAGYHLTFADEDLHPQDGEDNNYELSYDTGGYLDAESEGGRLVLLDPGQTGSLDVCRSETRFTTNIYVDKLSKGRQICITTGTGHLALLTYQGHSPEDSPSDYMTIDVTVWRNAVG